MNEARKILQDMFDVYKHRSDYKDTAMTEIMLRRKEFEETLDKMWQIYRMGNLRQVVEYKKQVQSIKEAGLLVLRSKTTGKHKIVYNDGKRGTDNA